MQAPCLCVTVPLPSAESWAMLSATPKHQHSFPERTPLPDGPESSPEPTTYMACRNGGSWDTSAWVLQPLQCLQEAWAIRQKSQNVCRSLLDASTSTRGKGKSLTPILEPGMCLGMDHWTNCFWTKQIGLLIPMHLLAVLGILMLCLKRYLGDASFFPFSCFIKFKAFSSPFPFRTCISEINCFNRIISFCTYSFPLSKLP